MATSHKHSPMPLQGAAQLQGAVKLRKFYDIYACSDRPPSRDYAAELIQHPGGITIYHDLLILQDGSWSEVIRNLAPPELKTE